MYIVILAKSLTDVGIEEGWTREEVNEEKDRSVNSNSREEVYSYMS